jgi:MarR family transcriptional regulator, organic hydroperoxide resistance regulator
MIPGGRPSEAGFLVAKVHQVGGRVFARMLKKSGGPPINPAQGRLLFALWKSKRGMSMTSLATETALEPSTLTSMIDRLEAAGLARRKASPTDRRALLVECTELGRRLEAEYRRVSRRMTELYFEGMSDEEVQAFEASLKKVLANLEQAERS